MREIEYFDRSFVAKLERSLKAMTLVNWREIVERITHIDAEFVGCQFGFPNKECFYRVKFYPWWEHPLFKEARKRNDPWGFSNLAEEGVLEVTVHPVDLFEVKLVPHIDVIDWKFTQDHSVLWPYADKAPILCNSPLTLEQWSQITTAVGQSLSETSWHTYFEGKSKYSVIARWGSVGSFLLGDYPRPVFLELCRELRERGISHYVGRYPEEKEMPVAFLTGSDSYIIAGDFQIDVPEFIHKPEWFSHGTVEATDMRITSLISPD